LSDAKTLNPDAGPDIDRSIAEVFAQQALDAQAAGDWAMATRLWSSAASAARDRYKRELLVAYLHANPVMPATAVLLAALAAVALLSGRKIGAPRRPRVVQPSLATAE
jgi:hypothetical protein